MLQAEANVKRGTTKRAAGMGRRALLGGLGATGALSLLGCPGNSGGPSPTPSPTPTGTPTNLPRGVPNATMLQNLGLVTSLAQRYRPNSFWVRAFGSPAFSGTPRPGQAWNYAFYSATSQPTLDIWIVFSDGGTSVLWGVTQPTPYDLVDVRAIAWVDSPQAMTAALSHGLGRCTADRPTEDWRVDCSYEQRAGFAGISVELKDSALSFQGRVLLSATDAQLIAREIRC